METKIIESLRHCTISEGDCKVCPSYHHDSGCPDKLHVAAADLLESQQKRIAELEAAGTWIPVTERLPEEGDRCLCHVKSFAFRGSFYQTILRYDKYGFREGNIYTDDVTHWMPLPKGPKEEYHG